MNESSEVFHVGATADGVQHFVEVTKPDDDGFEWAIVEIMGHRKHYGRTRVIERFGVKMLRVDIPKDGDPEKHGWETVFYSGAAIFSYSLSDEASVLRANKPYELPARYRLPAPEAPEQADKTEGEGGEPPF